MITSTAFVTLSVLALMVLCACSAGTTLNEKHLYNVALALHDSVRQLDAFGEYIDSDSLYAVEECRDIGIGVLGSDDFKDCNSEGRSLSKSEFENRTVILRAQTEQMRNHPSGGMDCLDKAYNAGAKYYVVHDSYLENSLIVSEFIRVYSDNYQARYYDMPSILVVSKWNKDGTVCRSRVGVIQP